MCGRLSNANGPTIHEIEEYLGAEFVTPEDAAAFAEPRYNIGPMQRHVIAWSAGDRRVLARARWGVERVIGKKPDGSMKIATPFNTVAETAMEKPQWRKSLMERRCVVPATGFYEWTGPKKDRRPLHFTRIDGQPLLLAGVYDEAKDDRPLAFSVLTTTPNALLAPIHDRMPVILDDGEAAHAWLAAPHPEMMRPARDDLLMQARANPIMNKAGVEGVDCLVVPRDLTE